MPLKIFHTADVHLGLKFGSYPEELSKLLSETRFETLESMVRSANSEKCDLFVVAGDLFDHIRVAQRDVIRAAKILGQFDRLVVILPGNHDYCTGQEDDLWNTFQSTLQDRVQVLTEKKPYLLKTFDLDVCIYPAPCQNKHSKSHSLGWITSEKKTLAQYHIGLAHGSFEGLTPDTEGEYYPMKKEDLIQCNLDFWLMGHIHVQFPQRFGAADRIFYPSTPEPDGFDCRHEGKAWILDINDEKQISAKSISTGKYRFRHENIKIQNITDLVNLSNRYHSPEFENTLLKLNLSGSISKEDQFQFKEIIKELKELFLFLKIDHSAVSLNLSPNDIDREFTRESFPHRLLVELTKNWEDSESLQIAYELINEVRKSDAVSK